METENWQNQVPSRTRTASPFASVGATLNNQSFHGTAAFRLQLQNVCQGHCGLGQSQQVLALMEAAFASVTWQERGSRHGSSHAAHLEGGDMDRLDVSSELLADHAVGQQPLLGPLGVSLGLVTLVHRHDQRN